MDSEPSKASVDVVSAPSVKDGVQPDTVFRPVLWVYLLAPAWVSVFCVCLERCLPEHRVWLQVCKAILLSAPAWLMLLWPVWGVFCGVRWRKWKIAGVLAMVGLAWSGLPSLLVEDPPLEGPRVISALVANVNSFSDQDDPRPLELALADLAADLVIIIEKRPMEIPGMDRVADNFEDDLPRISHGTAVFCRQGWSCEATITPEFGSDTAKMPLALVRLPATDSESSVCVLGIHGPPPAPFDPSGLGPYMEKVATAISDGRMASDWGPCTAGDGVVVVGDMNHVPGSLAHRTLLSTGLRDGLQGWGVRAASWPAGGGWPNFPVFALDAVLVGHGRVGGVRQVRVPGADHIAMYLTIGVE